MIKIDILLATYNSEKYLENQIDSLLNQSYPYFMLLLRDDGSTDKTNEIIKNYKIIYKEKIQLIRDDLGNIGSSRSFMELLKYSNADYIMFCDHDDIWLPNKIEITLSKMLECENAIQKEVPILIFTDLMVVDEDLNIISESFWKYQKLNPDISKNWKMLLASNVVTGCTIMINRKAKDAVLPFELPGEMIHDHWLAVNISKYGIIDYINTQTILYRQHKKNAIGASRYNIYYFILKLINLKNLFSILRRCYIMSKYFGIPFLELLFLKLKINFLRLIK